MPGRPVGSDQMGSRDFCAGAGGLLEVDAVGDAEELLEDRRYFLSTAARLVRRGILPGVSTTSGWLGRYHQELARVPQQMGNCREASKTLSAPHRTSHERYLFRRLAIKGPDELPEMPTRP